MATSRRESQPNNARFNGNMSPVLKPSESDQGLRRARSVPSSPDRRSSASTAASSSANSCRPSSSFNPRRTASSRGSSTHGKSTTLLHSVSAMVGAKQAAGIMRRRADKSAGSTSVWPHALTTPTTTSPNKDPASRAAKSPSPNVQKSKISTRSGAEKKAAAAAPSPSKPRTQKATTGAAGKTQAASSLARNPGAMAKSRTGLDTSAAPSTQRTTTAAAAAASKAAEEQDVELLMEEFDETESISTPSIEEHLQQRLPDPVDVTAYAASERSPSEPSSGRVEHENDEEVVAEHMFSEEKTEDLNGGGGNADAGLDTELKEAVNETELKKSVGETELNETVGEIESKGAVDEIKFNEADGETDPKDPELAVKEEAEATEGRRVLPATTKTPEVAQRWRKDDDDDGRSNEVAGEGRSKAAAMQERRNKVMALVGRFETAMSGRE